MASKITGEKLVSCPGDPNQDTQKTNAFLHPLVYQGIRGDVGRGSCGERSPVRGGVGHEVARGARRVYPASEGGGLEVKWSDPTHHEFQNKIRGQGIFHNFRTKLGGNGFFEFFMEITVY